VGCPSLAELVLDVPVVLPAEGELCIQLVVADPDDRGRRAVTLHTRPGTDGAGWTRHATALVESDTAERPDPLGAWPPPEAVPVPVAGHYERLRSIGLDYGPAFRGLRAAWAEGGTLWLDVALPDEEAGGFGVHPALLDAALHGIWLRPDDDACRLPFSWSGVRFFGAAGTGLRVRLAPAGPDCGVCLRAWGRDGTPVLAVDHLALRPVSPELVTGAAGLFCLAWADVDTPPAGAAAGPPVLLGAELPAQAPAVAVLACPAGQEPTAAAARVLGVVRAWVGEPRFAESRWSC